MHHDRPHDPHRDFGPHGPRDHRGWEGHRGPDCCERGGHRRGHCPCGPDCRCGPDCPCRRPEPDFGFERHFVSKAEMIEALEWYLSELLQEAQGVREAIADLRKEIAEASEASEATPAASNAKVRTGQASPKSEAPRRRRGRPRKKPAEAESKPPQS